MRVNEPEFRLALTPTGTADPLMQAALASVQNENPSALRLFVINTQSEYVQNETASTVKFVWNEQKTMSFDTDADLQAIADEAPNKVSGLQVASVEITIAPNRMAFGVVESEIKTKNATGGDITLRQKQIFFNSKSGVMEITLTTANDLRETVIPIFDAMMDTVQVTN